MGQFDRENDFLLSVARGTLSEVERKKFEELLSDGLEWNYVLTQLKRHKLLPLFANHCKSCKITKNSGEISAYLKTISIHSKRLEIELCSIASDLVERGIAYAVLKGPILAHAIYDIPVKRTYGDLDILVKKSDADAVSNILKEKGYIQGDFDKEKEEIVPVTRKVVVGYSMYTHQLYPFKKLFDQSFIVFDIHTKLHAPYRKGGQCVFDVDVSANSPCWQTLEQIDLYGERISTLNWNYFLLQICLHAYVNEVSIFSIVYDIGVNLRAYCDIRELILSKRDEINFEKFVELVQKTKAIQPIYYILANLSELYDDMRKIISSIIEQIRPTNLDFMNEFGYSMEILGEQRGQYSKPFIERIFDDSPQEDVKRQKHLFRPPKSQLEFLTRYC